MQNHFDVKKKRKSIDTNESNRNQQKNSRNLYDNKYKTILAARKLKLKELDTLTN